MKRLFLFLPLCAIAVTSCNNAGKNSAAQDTVSKADSVTASAPAAGDEAETKAFITKALSGGMMEIELGKLAQSNALEPRVKKFGEMMTADHSKAGDELKALAASKNILLPANLGSEHKKHIDELKTKTGVDFDKAYMKMMLKDHRDDIEDFEDAAKDEADADLKSLAAKTLPVLKKHLDSAKAINKKVKASLDPDDLTEGVETYPQR